jgi:uncharacterized membrane protein
MAKRFRDDCTLIEHTFADGTTKLVPHWKHAHPQVRNVNQETRAGFTPLERLALAVTVHVGSPGFFIIIGVWTIVWLLWNVLAPVRLRYDPGPAFVLWLFISNMLQILLMPLIMVGQNIQGRHAEARAEHDLEVNVKAEQEIEIILHHLEQQNDLLVAMLEKQGLKLEEVLRVAEARRVSSQPAPTSSFPSLP